MDTKHRLEEKISKLNMDIKNKNEKILELMENIEDLKIALYARDKTISLLEQEAATTNDKLAMTTQFEIHCKKLIVENESLTKANEALQKQINENLEQWVAKEVDNMDRDQVQSAMKDQVLSL